MVASNIPLAQEEPLSNNGLPMVGCKMYFYELGSSDTLKDTYQDPDLTTLNTNPVVSDGFGRLPSIFGRGGYRQVLKDPLDNQIWSKDIEAPFASANISTAVEALLGAETLQQFWDESYGPTALALAIAQINLLPGPTGPTGVTGSTGPTGPAGSSPNGYQPGFSGSNPLVLSFPNLNGTSQQALIQTGTSSTNSGGSVNVSFAIPYSTHEPIVIANCTSTRWWVNVTGVTGSGFTAYTASPLAGGSWLGSAGFTWIAIGV